MGHEHIPEQLLLDCHHLGGLPASELLLHRNAALPWFILVPQTPLQDVLDLPQEQLHTVMGESAAISSFIKLQLGFDKVNFAGLGNVVSAMHLHIIGRHSEDACWPQPVWGNLPEHGAYPREQLRNWQEGLVRLTGLKAVPL